MLMIEKALFLKSVGIFSGVPDDALMALADALEELELPPGHTICERGDEGSCMYLIAEGQVNIHDEERLLVTLDERKFFGELAALDTKLHTTTATTQTACRIFVLEQETLYELMSERVEVARSIIGFLCANLGDKYS